MTLIDVCDDCHNSLIAADFELTFLLPTQAIWVCGGSRATRGGRCVRRITGDVSSERICIEIARSRNSSARRGRGTLFCSWRQFVRCKTPELVFGRFHFRQRYETPPLRNTSNPNTSSADSQNAKLCLPALQRLIQGSANPISRFSNERERS